MDDVVERLKGKRCVCEFVHVMMSGRWFRSVEVAAVVDVGFLKPANAS